MNVNRRLLEWALDRNGLAPEDLVQRFPKLMQWLDGAALPTIRQLEDFAKATETPFGFLFLNEPPAISLPIPHFRTVDDELPDTHSPELIATVHQLLRRQAWLKEYYQKQGIEPLEFVGSFNTQEDPVTVANGIRSTLGLTENWASNESTWTDALKVLRETMDSAGIHVVVNGVLGNNTHRKLNTEEFRGFVLIDEFAPMVFINGADAKSAQMFTLAHELAHVFLGASAAFDLRGLEPAPDPTEQACNAIAAEFLVPQQSLASLWDSSIPNEEAIQVNARHFKVSRIVAARRALDLGLISRDEFFSYYNDHLEAGTSRPSSGGGNFYASQNLKIGNSFGATVLRALRKGELLYSEAYRLTGLRGDTFETYLQRAGHIDGDTN